MGRGITTTKFEIVQVASEFFFELGYSKTSPNMIAKELGISTGNISYYFPTKEHLLKVLVETLCDYQMKMIEAVNDIGMGFSEAEQLVHLPAGGRLCRGCSGYLRRDPADLQTQRRIEKRTLRTPCDGCVTNAVIQCGHNQ